MNIKIIKPRWLLLGSILSILSPVADASGASFQWLPLRDRERLVISLDASDSSEASLTRVSPNVLLLNLRSAPAGLLPSGATPGNDNIFSAAASAGNSISIATTTPAFGYFFYKQAPNQIMIDLFKDETGARWKQPNESTMVQNPAASPSPTPQVQAPTLPTQTPASAPVATPAQPVLAQQALAQQIPSGQVAPQRVTPLAPPVQAQPALPPQTQLAQTSPQQQQQQFAPNQFGQQAATGQQATGQQNQFGATPAAFPAQNAPQQFFPNQAPPQQAWPQNQPVQQAFPQGTPQQLPPSGTMQPGMNAPQQFFPTQAPPQQAWQQNPPVQPIQQVAPQTNPQQLAGGSGPSLSMPINLGDISAVPQPQQIQPQQAPPVPPSLTGGQATMQAPIPGFMPGAQPPMTGMPGMAGSQGVQQPVPPNYGQPQWQGQATMPPQQAQYPVQQQVQQQGAPQQALPGFMPGMAGPHTAQQPTPQQNMLPTPPATPHNMPVQTSGESTGPAPRHMELLVKSAPPAPVVTAEAGGNQPATPPPPPTPEELITETKRHMAAHEYDKVIPLLEALRDNMELNNEQREGVLHDWATAIYETSKNDIPANYQKIVSSTTEAMNFNLKSPHVATSLMRLGFVNLKLNNVQEAEAYFNILKKQFPDYANIPLIYYNWGEYYYGKKDYLRAADEYQYIIQNFPDNEHVRAAAIALARTYYNLGYYEDAYRVVEFVEKRWRRFYLEQPKFLNLLGDLAFRVGQNAKARNYYWTYYNIMPNGDEADMVLARLGDIYALDNQVNAARELYNEAYRNFPDKDGGLVSMMRLAEEGIYDFPTIGEMTSIFDNRQYSLNAVQAYNRILNDFPNSNLAPLARLKLGMWHLANKEYEKAIQEISTFANDYPKSPLLPKAREVALQAFDNAVADAIIEDRAGQATVLWDKFPIVREQLTEMQPRSKIALAASLWKSGYPQRALDTLESFFKGAKMPEYGDEALALALNILTENDRWEGIKTINDKVEMWELSDKAQQQLDFAVAMSEEKAGNTEKAVAIWKKLQGETNLHPLEQAYAQYFTATDAWKRRDLETAYRVGRESLRNFLNIAERDPTRVDQPKIVLLLNMLMDIAESSGRYREALDYLSQYPQYLEASKGDRLANLYREARLHNKMNDLPKWQSILTELVDKYPNTIYGRMAASELRSYKISEEASRFASNPLR